MASHKVRPGDFLAEIARKAGFVDWKVIYDLPANAALWARGRSPDLLLPGDEIEIPKKREKLAPRPTGARHPFKLKKIQNRLRVILESEDGNAFANEPFTMRIQAAEGMRPDEGLLVQKDTTPAGLIDEPLPPGAVKAIVSLDKKPWLSWTLLIGHLDPIEDKRDKKEIVTGVQARLNNLGFHCGQVDGLLGPRTRAAVAWFQQKKMRRPPEEANGELDGPTLAALLDKHRS